MKGVRMPDNDVLCQRLQAGQVDALSDFLEQHRPQLLAFIERRLGDALRRKVEPQDIYQEMAVAALKGISATDLSDRDPFGWLCQIAEQRIIDTSRKFASQKRSSDRELALQAPSDDAEKEWLSVLAASITSPSGAFARAERHEQLQRAIAELPAETRDVLKWRYVENMATKDIAAKIGKTDGAVRVMLTRTIHRLQEILTDQGMTSM